MTRYIMTKGIKNALYLVYSGEGSQTCRGQKPWACEDLKLYRVEVVELDHPELSQWKRENRKK